jgi:xylan 1,4-beta-xylosidase
MSRILHADLRQAGTTLPSPRRALDILGAGRAHEVLRARFLEHLDAVRAATGVQHLRFHGMYHDDMAVARRLADGRIVHGFQLLDECYDALIDRGIKPFVETSFMPSCMASGDKTVFWWKGNITPPKSLSEWRDLITASVRHWIARYGRAEVRQWHFEIWNEPDLHFFFSGTQDDYQELYATAARAIKDIDSELRVGGPATATGNWVDTFIAACHRRGDPLDFFATHGYAVKAGQFLDELGTQELFLDDNPYALADYFSSVRQRIRASPLPNLPLHITEWNSSYSPRDAVHDHYANAAFILDQVERVGNDVDSMAYWTVSDVFEEPGPPTTPFHGGFGLVGYQGWHKPSFHAHRFLAALGSRSVPQADPRARVHLDERGGVQVLAWDRTVFAQDACNQRFYRRDLPPTALPPLAVNLTDATPGTWRWQATRIGHRANDVFATYLDLGLPDHLNRSQEQALAAVGAGAPEASGTLVVGADGVLALQLPMRSNDCLLVELTPAG